MLGIKQINSKMNGKIARQQGKMKESWKIINQVLNKWSKSTNVNNLSTPDGVTVNK